MKIRYTLILLSILIVSTAAPLQAQHTPHNLRLWYKAPAVRWTDTLPIGNGRIGGMIYGDVLHDRIQFNEETLWADGPRQHARAGASAYLAPIRKLLAEGKQKEAEALAEAHFMGMRSNEKAYDSLKKAWLAKVSAAQAPADHDFDDDDWKTMEQPVSSGGWEKLGHEGLDGAVWFRTSFTLPKQWEGKDLVVQLGRVRDVDFTYVNGRQVGTTTGNANREYKLDAALLKKGRNYIAVQVINYYDKGGFAGAGDEAKALVIYPAGQTPNDGVMLDQPWKYWVQDAAPPAFPRYQADYQPFGDVYLDFSHKGKVADYRRELDITNAVSSVTYTVDGVKYTREYFVSAPHQVMAIHIRADKPGRISLEAALKSPHLSSATSKYDERTLALSLQVKNGALRGESHLRVEAVKGKVKVTDEGIITVTGADQVTLYLSAGTNFKKYNDVTGNPETVSLQDMQKVAGKAFQAIKAAHISDYQQYFNTLSLDLGTGVNATLPTDERLQRYTPAADPSLLTLYLQYGRYLLISSSRPGTQPANLQGIWNDLLMPPWGSKYTANINLQMNYWPVYQLNLAPCADPLLKLIDEVAETGKVTAREHYNANGWVLHHNTDLWRGTAPINAANHGIWVTGNAWLCHHLWQHYLFTQDRAFLEQRAYPIMKQALAFFLDFLVKDPATGLMISTPSNSPEQGGLVAGPTMDHQLIRDLFRNCLTAAEMFGERENFRKYLKTRLDQIAPNRIGKHGQLQEWMKDVDDPDNKHRHVSHLWGVYPGTDITWDTPDMMKAARQSLLQRGDGGTGWSLAWKVNLWARFKDGDHTLLMAGKLLEPAIDSAGRERGGAYNNLFDAHPPFQIDGNFGGAAGIAEMLVQSHMPYIELLPALPSALPKGVVKGLCARGGFVVDLQWQNGKLAATTITSTAGKECVIRYGDKQAKFPTTKGKSYTLDANLKMMNAK